MSSHLIGCKVRENYSVIASYLKIFRSCKDYWQRIGTLLGGIWRWKKNAFFGRTGGPADPASFVFDGFG
jgi:hypothetical protein